MIVINETNINIANHYNNGSVINTYKTSVYIELLNSTNSVIGRKLQLTFLDESTTLFTEYYTITNVIQGDNTELVVDNIINKIYKSYMSITYAIYNNFTDILAKINNDSYVRYDDVW